MRTPVIAANWKMYKTQKEAAEFCQEIKEFKLNTGVESIIFAPFTALGVLQANLADTPIKIGAQNFYPQKEGAFTGEISSAMLAEVGASYVLVGHSERRSIFKEDDMLLNEKVKAALKAGLTPILCCGEPLAVREENQAISYCLRQLETALFGVEAADMARIIIAYEPIWAIGSGQAATAQDAQEMLGSIRIYLAKSHGHEVADDLRIIYGGSVNVGNIGAFLAMPDVDGALVGGASLKAQNFAAMING